MDGNKRGVSWFVFLAVVATLGCGQGDSGTEARPDRLGSMPELGRAALLRVAQRTGQSLDALDVVNASVGDYPLQAQSAVHFKVLDRRSGHLHPATIDATGMEIDAEALFARERAAREARYGKLHPGLHALANGAAPDSLLDVTLWVTVPPSPVTLAFPRLRLGAASSDETAAAKRTIARVRTEAEALRAADVRSVVDAVAARLSTITGHVEPAAFAPAISTRLTPAALAEVSRWPEIERIYPVATARPELDIVRSVIHTQIVHSQGFRGGGVKVAVVEATTGTMATDNPFLAGITQDLTSNCPQVSIHPTIIAGIIHSSNSTVRGIAPSSDLWLGGACSGTDADLQQRATAAVSWGARILSLSWGDKVDSMRILSANDRFFDDMVFNRLRTVVKSAGNHGETDSEDLARVTSPGLAYNVITAGGFDDQNTTGWPDDQMAPFSSWGDPLSFAGDREKPEVVAPADEIKSTITESPWLGEGGGSGTSWAAPVVAGMTALIIDANAALELWPEAIKAIVMASAIHNIEDDSRLSEKDGAGGVDAQTAVNLARELNNNGWEAFNTNCVPGPATTVSISLSAGHRTRVAIAWSTDPDYADYEDRPSADLDLQVLSPSGTIVATSSSFDNTYEIVDFSPTVSGVHTVRVIKSRCQRSPRRLGVAWYRQ